MHEENNGTARAARTLVQFFDVFCHTKLSPVYEVLATMRASTSLILFQRDQL